MAALPAVMPVEEHGLLNQAFLHCATRTSEALSLLSKGKPYPV